MFDSKQRLEDKDPREVKSLDRLDSYRASEKEIGSEKMEKNMSPIQTHQISPL